MQGYFLSRPLAPEAFDAWMDGYDEGPAEADDAPEGNVVEFAPKRAVND
jgi:hypothetical protein